LPGNLPGIGLAGRRGGISSESEGLSCIIQSAHFDIG